MLANMIPRVLFKIFTMSYLTKIKWWWVVAGVLVLMVAFGIYNNPERYNRTAYAEYQKLGAEEMSRKAELQNLSSQYVDCFDKPSTEIIDRCLDGIAKIKKLTVQETETINKWQVFYDSQKDKLFDADRVFLENNLRALNSEEYQDTFNATIGVMDAYTRFYTFINGSYDTSGLSDSMSRDERIKYLARVIAGRNIEREDVVNSLYKQLDNLEEKKATMTEYLRANFSADFLSKLGLPSKEEEACGKKASEAYDKDLADLGDTLLEPEYHYNTRLGTCLYANGQLTSEVSQRWVNDLTTDKPIILYMRRLIDGEFRPMRKEICPECVSTPEEFESQKNKLFSE